MIQVSQLGGSTSTGFQCYGSEDFGFCLTNLTASVVDRLELSYLIDPPFAKPRKRLRERYYMRHCDHLKTEGQIILADGFQEGDSVYVDERGFVHPIIGGIFYANLLAPAGEALFEAPYSSYASQRFIKWTAAKTGRVWDCQVGYASRESGVERYWWTIVQFQIILPDSTQDPDDPTAIEFGRSEVWSTVNPVYQAASTLEKCRDAIRSVWIQGRHDFIETSPMMTTQVLRYHSIPYSDAMKEVLHAVRVDDIDEDLIEHFDLNLFPSSIQRFRGQRFSWLESVIGYQALPQTVKEMLESVLGFLKIKKVKISWLTGRSAHKITGSRGKGIRYPLTRSTRIPLVGVNLKALCGAYLIWLYAIRPIDSDRKVVADFLRRLTDKSRFDGTKIPGRTTFSLGSRERREKGFDDWAGVQRSLIQCLPTEIPATSDSLSDRLDAIDESGATLAAWHGYALSGEFHWPDVLTNASALADVLPILPADFAHEFWNYIGMSFVVDWFINVGAALDNLSQKEWLLLVPVEYACETVKASRDVSVYFKRLLEQLTTSPMVSVSETKYSRRYSRRVPDFPLFHSENFAAQSVWLQGTALLLQRLL